MNNIFTESIYKNININQKMLLYFYFVYEFSLYVYNQNSIKKLLLLFLKPKILLKLLDKLNNKTKLLIINCFFINIISLNNNIKKINIEEINRFLKQPKEFEYIYLLYKNINVNNLYCNTIIYYNIINYFLNKKVHLTIRKYINLIYNLNNIYYYIPYFLINIKIFIEESNIDYNKLYYLRNILINYLYQIYIKINYLYQNLILLKDFIDKYLAHGIQQIFCTDVSKDGKLEGPSLDLYKSIIQRFPKLELIASGGVANMDDLFLLKQIGCSGAIIGKAIYEGRITLQDLKQFV